MRRVVWASLLALLIGLGAGLAYAWVIAPARYSNTSPNTLRADFKDQFRALIAASYSATHNLERARARLALLGDADPVEALSAQAQRMLASGESFQVVQQVAGLASDLQSNEVSEAPTPSVSATGAVKPSPAVPTPSPRTPTQTTSTTEVNVTATEDTATDAATTAAVFDTPTARPTMTLSPTPSAPFRLASQDQVCNPNLTEGLMQVSTLDNRRHQVAGVEIDISWAGGEETFFTGLKPEIGNGYADYVMQAGVVYSVRVGRVSDTVPNLTAPSCTTSSGQTYLGGLKLVFQQP